MRQFHSYGPVDCEEHFCARRETLVRRCTDQLIGKPGKSGHYFTIWAPRQTGKTWLMRQVKKAIEHQHGDKLTVGTMSVQGIIMEDDDPDEVLLRQIPRLFWETFGFRPDPPEDWGTWMNWFVAGHGLFDKPLILFIDEFDSLPARIIDQLVTLFRDMYLKKDAYCLHGLALIGVRAVLGVESLRGSPFNIQRSLHVPNLTQEEVGDLYAQYQAESGQTVAPEVVREVCRSTRGQPGLVSWIGELLTEKYNPGENRPITLPVWEEVFEAALHAEWNNTLLNLIKKARGPYVRHVLELFTKSDIPFTLRADWCSFLYLNGITDRGTGTDVSGKKTSVCRFASPFVQTCLYDALADDIVGDRMPILALEPLDDLADVFEKPAPDLPALLERYKDYLRRLRAGGLNPWKDQPRRADMHLTEAAGHFHLYSWLREALREFCVVSPEFPTGNGKVDLHLRCGGDQSIIEVKSFRSMAGARAAQGQAARYARGLGLDTVVLALFVPVEDDEVLAKISGDEVTEGVRVAVVAIGWV